MTSPRPYDGGRLFGSPSFSDTPIYDSLVAERGTPQMPPVVSVPSYDSALPALPALPSAPSPQGGYPVDHGYRAMTPVQPSRIPPQQSYQPYQQQQPAAGGYRSGYEQAQQPSGGYRPQPANHQPAGYQSGGYPVQPEPVRPSAPLPRRQQQPQPPRQPMAARQPQGAYQSPYDTGAVYRHSSPYGAQRGY